MQESGEAVDYSKTCRALGAVKAACRWFRDTDVGTPTSRGSTAAIGEA